MDRICGAGVIDLRLCSIFNVFWLALVVLCSGLCRFEIRFGIWSEWVFLKFFLVSLVFEFERLQILLC